MTSEPGFTSGPFRILPSRQEPLRDGVPVALVAARRGDARTAAVATAELRRAEPLSEADHHGLPAEGAAPARDDAAALAFALGRA